MKDFADRLNEALKMRNMKQKDLARITGIDKGTISNYCKAKYQPKIEKRRIIAQALNVSPAWLSGFDVPADALSEDLDFVSDMENAGLMAVERPDISQKYINLRTMLNAAGFELDRKTDGSYFLTGEVNGRYLHGDITEEQLDELIDSVSDFLLFRVQNILMKG